MKIALLVDRIPRVQGGGATFEEDALEALLEIAAASEHEFVVAGPARDAELDQAGLPKNVALLDTGSATSSRMSRAMSALAPGLMFARKALGWRTPLDRRLRSCGVDVVWFLTPMFVDTDMPYVYTVWDLQHRLQPWFPEVSSGGRWLYREAMYSQAAQRAMRVIVANKRAQSELQSFYGVPPENILCLPHPTPTFALRFENAASPSTAIAPFMNVPFVFYPAQFWPHKNHVMLLKALARIRERGAGTVHAVMCGSDVGNQGFVRDRAVALGVDDIVHFPGFVSRDDLVNLYRHAVALAFPSMFWPENLPPLEAMALGCPVIAAHVAGAEEQLGDAARLVDPLDVDAWANAIIELRDSPEHRSTLLERGRRRARAWTARDYVTAVCAELDRFALVRECWR